MLMGKVVANLLLLPLFQRHKKIDQLHHHDDFFPSGVTIETPKNKNVDAKVMFIMVDNGFTSR